MAEVLGRTFEEIDDERDRENMRKLEAALFVSGRFLSMQELVSYTDLNPIIIREVIEKLQERYDELGSALTLIKKGEEEGGSGEELWKMDVRSDYSHMINKLATGNAEFVKSEQETLAIIAYKQPIKQSVIIKIRGNKAYDHIKKFVDLGLVKKKKIGHTHELSLSDDFYDYFNLETRSVGGILVEDSDNN